MQSLSVALKEWDAVGRALGDGRQLILLRKGGISERGGTFHVEHRQFLLFPTFLHQNKNLLKSGAHGDYQPLATEPARLKIELAADVTDILKLRDRTQMDALDDEHVWTPPLIDMRFNYRPENPLYLLIVRAHRLCGSVTIENTPAYEGCKSWVPLDRAIDVQGATQVLVDERFEQRRHKIRDAITRSTPVAG